nr:hypothetical protein [Bacillus sp. SH5-2]
MSKSPPFTGLGLAVLTIAISAELITGVVTVEVLLDGSGSGVEDSTIAVFVMESIAAELTVPRIKMVIVEPIGNVPKGRIPGQGLNVTPPSVENSGFATSLGIRSVSVTFSATDGPKLEIVNV